MEILIFLAFTQEIWRQVKRYPNYEISNYWKIRHIKNRKERKLFKKNWYFFIQLKAPKNEYIHRLVCEAFNPRPKPYKSYNYVNHKNLNKHDNTSHNLEWVTQATNIQHYHVNKK